MSSNFRTSSRRNEATFFSPLRLDFGGEKSFHARQREETKKLEEEITRVLGSSIVPSSVVPILTVWQSCETFFVYFFGKKSALLSMGIKKIWKEKKVLMIYSFRYFVHYQKYQAAVFLFYIKLYFQFQIPSNYLQRIYIQFFKIIWYLV